MNQDTWALAEIERMLANIVRLGVVAELDDGAARVKVHTAGTTTDWMPWLAARAGSTRTWSAPRPGEQVVVLSPYGDLAQGVALTGLYQDAHPAPESSKDVESIVLPDGATHRHDSAGSHYLFEVPSKGSITIKCGASSIVLTDGGIALNAPRLDLN